MQRSDVIKMAATSAGEAVLKATPTEGITEKEGRANFVTAADLASEKAIVELLSAHFPDDAILSEETTSDIRDPLQVERLWIIDPIDGTSNFRYERNYSSISIAYVEKGEMIHGAVYDPYRKELFFAEKGRGAFLNNRPIKVSTQSTLGKATVATDNSYDPEGTKYNIELALKLSEMPWMLMKGSAVLTMCEVASGRIDLYYHTTLKPWDNAAAFLIAKEAGAVITGIDGREITFMSSDVVMGNEDLVDQFLKGIKE